MSVSRPAQCLFSVPLRPKQCTSRQCLRSFSTTPNLNERRRRRFANVKAADMGLISAPSPAQAGLRDYSEAEKADLRKRYTASQVRAIEAGEEAIDPNDVIMQGRIRLDPGRLPYLDDLSTIQPVIDKRAKVPSTIPHGARFLTQKEQADDVFEWLKQEHDEWLKNKPLSVPEEEVGEEEEDEEESRPNRLDFMKYMEESTGMTGGGRSGSPSTAPALPKIKELEDAFKKSEEADPEDPEGRYTSLIKQTGMDVAEIKAASVKILVRHRVVNQTRLGKIQSTYCLSVAGDGNGLLGIGEGKSQEVEEAMKKSRHSAIRNMKPVPRYEGRTIFGEVEGKVAAAEVKLMARPPGFGVRCQHNIFEMCRAAGIHDLAARVPRSRNKMNTIKAAYQALMSQRIPDEVARGRGKKLVDVRKVYYGGDQTLPKAYYDSIQRR